MWEALVILVRLPFTCVALAFATVVGIPFIIGGRVAFFVLGYLIAPFKLVWHAFNNEREEFSSHMRETGKLLSELPQSIENMYKEIFKWGFPSQ